MGSTDPRPSFTARALAALRARLARPAEPEPAGLAILFGIRAVARYLGLSKNQARSLAARGLVPTFDLGGVTCARKATLRRHVETLERDGTMRALRRGVAP